MRPIENTTEMPILRFFVIWSFQITRWGSRRMNMSMEKLKAAVQISSFFRSMHFPDTHVCQIFSRGTQASTVAMIQEPYHRTLMIMRKRPTQKNVLRWLYGTKMRVHSSRMAGLDRSIRPPYIRGITERTFVCEIEVSVV